MKNTLDKKHMANALSYIDYCQMAEALVKQGKVSGKQQSDELTQYARLHCHRMHRIDRSIVLLPEIKSQLQKITAPQTWIVLTETWCGDAAQIIPILNAFTKLNDNINLKLLLRDDNLELMDQYLTNGKSRSIPKLVVFDTNSTEELFHWGPRPSILQAIMNNWVTEEWPFEEMKEALHLWYAKDEGVAIQAEISALLQHHFT